MKEINIKEGMPMAHVATSYLEQRILDYRKGKKVKLLKVVHGYGSTGKGGKIKRAVKKRLDHLQINNIIIKYILGENFDIFNDDVKDLISKGYEISGDEDLGKVNSGITIVVIR